MSHHINPQMDHVRAFYPDIHHPIQIARWSVWSWTKTSTAHGYPTRDFTGDYTECETWIAKRNLPERYEIRPSEVTLKS